MLPSAAWSSPASPSSTCSSTPWGAELATQLGLPGIPLGGGISGALQGLLGSQAVRSIAEWMMLQNLVQALEGPLTAELGQVAFGQFPTLASAPEQLAAGVVRGHVEPQVGFDEAKKSGYDKAPFQLLLDNAGQPLPLQALLEAWRRGFIPKAGSGADSIALEQGIRESDLKNKWTAVVEQLQFQLAPPGTVVEGWLRAQLDEAPARDLLRQNGIDDATATLMYKAAGRPPSPQELLELEHRGVIPLKGRGGDKLSVEQGFLETDLKNKWFDVWTHLGEYLPPPRTVTAMMREGALTDAQGAEFFKKAGLTPDLVQAYVEAAHHQKTTASKEATKADILSAYQDGLMTHAQAKAALVGLTWAPAAAELELAMADFRQVKKLMDGAITSIRTAYIARKLSPNDARTALAKLGVATSGISSYFAAWNVDRQAHVVRLSAAQWATAAKNGWLTPEQVLSQLQGMGYSAFEAWVYLSDALKAPATASPPPADVPASYTAGP